MATVRPFRALRPRDSDMASRVAALPYDVMSSDEARDMVYGNPYSFLHIDKAEIDLSRRIDIYSDQVYEKARDNFARMLEENVFIQDSEPCFYIYKLTMEGHPQLGVVACTSIDEYTDGIIRKHELTLEAKEMDRYRHIDILDANTGPIFLTYRKRDNLDRIIGAWVKSNEPIYDFSSDDDGICHTVWLVDDKDVIKAISEAFIDIPYLYIADGHHRNASAVKVGQKRREENPYAEPNAEFNFYLSVIFPHDQLRIFDYNRIITGLNGLSPEGFIECLNQNFDVERYAGLKYPGPEARHSFGMYLERDWYTVKARRNIINEAEIVQSLDVSLLQKYVISAILGIDDPRTDKRIGFVGGIRGYGILMKLVDSGEVDVAFTMYPTSMEELLTVADQYRIMPPKSTWFEPKLRSGLFIHLLNGDPDAIDRITEAARIRRAAEEARLLAERAAAEAELKNNVVSEKVDAAVTAAEAAHAEKAEAAIEAAQAANAAANAARTDAELKAAEAARAAEERKTAEAARADAERKAAEAAKAAEETRRAAATALKAAEEKKAAAARAKADEERKAAEAMAKAAEQKRVQDAANATTRMQNLLNLIADKFDACKDMDEVRQAVRDVRVMAE